MKFVGILFLQNTSRRLPLNRSDDQKFNYISLIFLNLQLNHVPPEWSHLFWCNEGYLLMRKMSGSIPEPRLFVNETTVSTFWLSSELRLHQEYPYRKAPTRFLERLNVYWAKRWFNCESRLYSTYFNLHYIILQSIFSLLATS